MKSLQNNLTLNLTRFILLGIVMTLEACAATGSWKEEVHLNDGRTIMIEQWRLYDNAYDGDKVAKLQREARISFTVPELGKDKVEWHERLTPLLLNIHQGKWYIVGFPPTGAEYDYYKWPRHTYVPFRFDDGKWQRIPFKDIPPEIYKTNLWLGNNPPEHSPAKQQDRDAYVKGEGLQMIKEFIKVDPNYFGGGAREAVQSNFPITE